MHRLCILACTTCTLTCLQLDIPMLAAMGSFSAQPAVQAINAIHSSSNGAGSGGMPTTTTSSAAPFLPPADMSARGDRMPEELQQGGLPFVWLAGEPSPSMDPTGSPPGFGGGLSSPLVTPPPGFESIVPGHLQNGGYNVSMEGAGGDDNEDLLSLLTS